MDLIRNFHINIINFINVSKFVDNFDPHSEKFIAECLEKLHLQWALLKCSYEKAYIANVHSNDILEATSVLSDKCRYVFHHLRARLQDLLNLHKTAQPHNKVNLKTDSVLPCQFCLLAGNVRNCPSFLALSNPGRTLYITQNNFCEICYSSLHTSKKCVNDEKDFSTYLASKIQFSSIIVCAEANHSKNSNLCDTQTPKSFNTSVAREFQKVSQDLRCVKLKNLSSKLLIPKQNHSLKITKLKKLSNPQNKHELPTNIKCLLPLPQIHSFMLNLLKKFTQLKLVDKILQQTNLSFAKSKSN